MKLLFRLAFLALLASARARADWVVQVAAFADSSFLRQMVESLRKAGFPVMTEPLGQQEGPALTRLLAGPYETKAEAQAAAVQLAARGWPGYVKQRTESRKPAPGPPTPSPAAKKQPIAPPPPGARPSQKGSSVPPAPVPPEPTPSAPPAPSSPPSPSLQPARPAEPPPAASSASSEAASSEPAPPADEPPAQSLESFLADARQKAPAKGKAAPGAVKPQGFFQTEGGYATLEPRHLTKFRNTLEASFSGKLGDSVGWKVGGRGVYDAIYDLSDFYPDAVRKDQRLEAMFRETFLDVSAGDFDLRVGRQNIVWGEVIGLFFADVVSAKDFRDFLVRDFDLLRIPQWATRAEWTKGDFHAEAIWIPYMTYDDIGVPFSEFYPYPPPAPQGFGQVILDEVKPPHTLANSAYGLRVSLLAKGWDVSAFYYDSVDASAAFFRTAVTDPSPAVVYEPRHERIHQIGVTATKDFGSLVFKGEAAYTLDRLYAVSRASEPTGLVPQDALDYTLGVDVPFGETRLNAQFFQRFFPDRDPDNLLPRLDSGVTVDLRTQLLQGKLEPELLFIRSLNDEGWLGRAKLTWNVLEGFRLAAGFDTFGGPATGFFGRYAAKDRAFAELRYTF